MASEKAIWNCGDVQVDVNTTTELVYSSSSLQTLFVSWSLLGNVVFNESVFNIVVLIGLEFNTISSHEMYCLI